MLTCSISSFKSIDSLQFQVTSEHEFVLLDGSSGAGKTTVLNAIVWCLYGSRTLLTARGVSSRTRKSTSVQLQIQNLTVRRQNRPDRLEVVFDSDQYENEYAQAVIDQLVGPYTVFTATSHIGQGELCSFVSMSGSARYELLQTILFTNGRDLHQRVQADLKSNRKSVDSLEAQIDAAKHDYESALASLPDKPIDWPQDEPDEPDQLRKEVDLLQNRLSCAMRTNDRIDRLTSEVHQYEQEVARLVNELQSYSSEPPRLSYEAAKRALADERQKYESLQETAHLVKRQTELQLQLDSLEEVSETQDELGRQIELAHRYDHLQTKLKSYHDVDRTNSIETVRERASKLSAKKHKLKSIESTLSLLRAIEIDQLGELSLDQIRVYANYSSAAREVNRNLPLVGKPNRTHLNQLDSAINGLRRFDRDTHIPTASLHELEQHIKSTRDRINGLRTRLGEVDHEIELAKSTLTCPHCKSHVVLQNGELVRGSAPSTYLQEKRDVIADELSSLETELEKARKQVGVLHAIDQLRVDTGTNRRSSIRTDRRSFTGTDGTSSIRTVGALVQQLKSDRDELKRHVNRYDEQARARVYLSEMQAQIPSLEIGNSLRIDRADFVRLADECAKYVKLRIDIQPKLALTTYEEKQRKLRRAVSAARWAASLLPKLEAVISIEGELEQTTWPNESVSSLRRRLRIRTERDHILNQLARFDQINFKQDDLIKCKDRLVSLEQDVERAQKWKERTRVENELTGAQDKCQLIQSELASLSRVSIDELQLELDKTKTRLGHAQQVHAYLAAERPLRTLLASIERKERDLNQTQNKLQLQSELLARIESTRIGVMQRSLREVSARATSLACKMFSSPIAITISPTKQLKSSNKIKPEVSITANLNGIDYTQIKSLSGGEQARVSIAILLALNSLLPYPCRLVLLDESLASLDEVHRDSAVETIRNYCANFNNCIVLSVLHECDRGLFDETITL